VAFSETDTNRRSFRKEVRNHWLDGLPSFWRRASARRSVSRAPESGVGNQLVIAVLPSYRCFLKKVATINYMHKEWPLGLRSQYDISEH